MALNKKEKESLIEKFQINGNDSGSIEVQIALLTTHIRELTDHCQKHAKDFSAKRGVLKMVCRRRRFLSYIMKNDADKYKNLIKQLGLRK